MPKLERHHDLDSLRCTMLMLGLIVHASQAYFTKGLELDCPNRWYFQDTTGSIFMAPLFAAIHVYRMPVFFVLAGFFAALLVAKRGLGGLMTNRAARVAAPLAVSILTIVPLIYLASEYAWTFRGGTPNSINAGLGHKPTMGGNLYHLWFLWHLIVCYIATWVAIQFCSCFKSVPAFQKLSKHTNQLVNSNWGIFFFAAISLVFLAQMKTMPGFLDTAFGFAPPWYVLGIYGLCYIYGWFLFRNRSRIKRLANRAHLRIAIGVSAVTAYLCVLGWYLESGKLESMRWILVLLSAISIWTLIEGWLAVFQKYFDKPNSISRYIADSSYWVYLIHVPIMIVCQGFLANTNFTAEIKFVIALSTGSTLSLLSYHYVVRATWIGKFLNGRRHPITRPEDASVGVVGLAPLHKV